MDDQVVDVRERRPKWRESIRDRRELYDPVGYVRVYHETKDSFISAIDKEGLRPGTENRNLGSHDSLMRSNTLMDEARPAQLASRGISRLGLYAYPYLEHGHGLDGASERFVRHDWNYYESRFEGLKKYDPDELVRLGVKTLDDFIYKMTDPNYLRSRYPGEVLELMVDPEACFVGDGEYFNRVSEDLKMGRIPSETVTRTHGKEYWENGISLADFLRWYRRPEYMSDGKTIRDGHVYQDKVLFASNQYRRLKGAPTHYPSSFIFPEILIPGSVPQEHIRLVA